MESLVHDMLSNAMAVTALAAVVAVLGRACRRPALIHSLCLVAIVKLVTPPVVPVSLPWPLPMSASAQVNAHDREPIDVGPAETDVTESLDDGDVGLAGVPPAVETPIGEMP